MFLHVFACICMYLHAVEIHVFENCGMQECPAAGGKVGQNAARRNSHRQEIEGNWNFEIRKV